MLPYEYELIDKLLESKGLNHLKSKRLYKRKYSEVVAILNLFFNLTEEQKELFMPLLTSNIWNSNPENVKAIINCKIWKNSLYSHLLSKSIWNKSINKIESVIETMEELKLERYITIACLNLSPIQIKALYHYMQENNISVIISDKLNPLFNIAPSIMLKRYGINLKQLVAKERELENGLSK